MGFSEYIVPNWLTMHNNSQWLTSYLFLCFCCPWVNNCAHIAVTRGKSHLSSNFGQLKIFPGDLLFWLLLAFRRFVLLCLYCSSFQLLVNSWKEQENSSVVCSPFIEDSLHIDAAACLHYYFWLDALVLLFK